MARARAALLNAADGATTECLSSDSEEEGGDTSENTLQ